MAAFRFLFLEFNHLRDLQLQFLNHLYCNDFSGSDHWDGPESQMIYCTPCQSSGTASHRYATSDVFWDYLFQRRPCHTPRTGRRNLAYHCASWYELEAFALYCTTARNLGLGIRSSWYRDESQYGSLGGLSTWRTCHSLLSSRWKVDSSSTKIRNFVRIGKESRLNLRGFSDD